MISDEEQYLKEVVNQMFYYDKLPKSVRKYIQEHDSDIDLKRIYEICERKDGEKLCIKFLEGIYI